MPTFQNALIDAIACFYKTNSVSVPDLDFINGHVLSNSKIKAFLIDQMAYDVIWSEDADKPDLVGKEVSGLIQRGGELAIKVFWAVRNADPEKKNWPSHWRNRCNYHNHETDDTRECCRKLKDTEEGDEE